jgi:hypothetical protein
MIDIDRLAKAFAIDAAGVAKLDELRERMWAAEINAA